MALGVGYRVQSALDAIVFQTYSDLEGYLWSFRRADDASVGIATRLDSPPSQELWHRVDRFLAEMCPDAKREKRWLGNSKTVTARQSVVTQEIEVAPEERIGGVVIEG